MEEVYPETRRRTKHRQSALTAANIDNEEGSMATSKSKHSGFSGDNDTTKAVSDSAQRIWLAGLGAFERAKAEGPKMFNVLVEQGKEFAERARGAADQALKNVRESASGAGGRFDKLEQVFEDRVSKSLGRLGVMTRGEVADLSRQVAHLTDEVRTLTRASAGGGGKVKRGGATKAGAVKRKAKGTVRKAKRGK
jgi:poly(hydroxyalkanoate) granule-associated protein